eukprot:TRINITY_DN29046_c0_g1_i1.p1 TRINITY_DN29046_c0_g1~~TRINITY_DN29046_c0_g1_i1.p1  ORF type:complete len:118 (+),score=13.33 TRINITY_DN29046_c0_g1_i1:624-977(+)
MLSIFPTSVAITFMTAKSTKNMELESLPVIPDKVLVGLTSIFSVICSALSTAAMSIITTVFSQICITRRPNGDSSHSSYTCATMYQRWVCFSGFASLLLDDFGKSAVFRLKNSVTAE